MNLINNDDFKVYNKSCIKISVDPVEYNLFDLKYAEEIEDSIKLIHNLPIFRHKYNAYILFNKIYESENSYHQGEHFVILKYYGVKKKEKNEDGTDKYVNWMVIKFLESYTVVTVPYFNKDSIYRVYDPYHPTYNGYCSIGNIDINEYKDLYNIWQEIMRRLFDPTYDLFAYFGGRGTVLRFPYLML